MKSKRKHRYWSMILSIVLSFAMFFSVLAVEPEYQLEELFTDQAEETQQENSLIEDEVELTELESQQENIEESIGESIEESIYLDEGESLFSEDTSIEFEENEGMIEEYKIINPLYKDVVKEEDLLSIPDISMVYAEGQTDTSQYYATAEDAGKSIREGLKNREEIVVAKYKNAVNDTSIYKEIWEAALEHTGVPTEGDYLKWQYAGITVRVSYRRIGGVYYYDFWYTVTYYTTQEQEEWLDGQITTILNNLKTDKMTQYQKIKAIYDYVCQNVSYDYQNVSDAEHTLKYTAYAAVRDGKVVCQGFANLIYRLCLESGIDCRLIAGTSGSVNHGWNIVALNGVYYNVDSTWDSGQAEYAYFLLNDADFRGHVRKSEYNTQEFYSRYPMGKESYKKEDDALSIPLGVKGLTVGGRTYNAIRLNWKQSDDAYGYIVEQYKNGAWTRIVKINGKSTTTYRIGGLQEGTAYRFRVKVFNWNGSVSTYSQYKEITAKTAPSEVIGLAIGGKTYNAIRLNWKANKSAEGYIIEQYKKGVWTRIAKINGNSIVTYRVNGLEADTTYRFRVKTFVLDGTVGVYGTVKEIAGKTIIRN